MKEEDDLTVVRCHHCVRKDQHCPRCQDTGSLFWVGGHSYPYTPDGEKAARRLSAMIKAGMA